jgi:predicted nucleic acid-binding protein
LTDFYDKIIVSDTSCFIAFTNIGRLNLLQSLCPFIITTPEVATEYRSPLPPWVKIIEVKDRSKIISINTLLGLGESSAIALAIETKNSLVVLDDKQARMYAKNIGLSYTGIIGLLHVGYRKGFINDIDSIIVDLQSIKFHLPKNAKDLIITVSRE